MLRTAARSAGPPTLLPQDPPGCNPRRRRRKGSRDPPLGAYLPLLHVSARRRQSRPPTTGGREARIRRGRSTPAARHEHGYGVGKRLMQREIGPGRKAGSEQQRRDDGRKSAAAERQALADAGCRQHEKREGHQRYPIDSRPIESGHGDTSMETLLVARTRNADCWFRAELTLSRPGHTWNRA